MKKIVCYDSLLQVPFCEDESVQLFRIAFFRSDFLQNPYFRVKACLFEEDSNFLNISLSMYRKKDRKKWHFLHRKKYLWFFDSFTILLESILYRIYSRFALRNDKKFQPRNWLWMIPNWSQMSMSDQLNHLESIWYHSERLFHKPVSWLGPFFAVSYSKPALGTYSVVSIKRTGSLNYFEVFYHPVRTY